MTKAVLSLKILGAALVASSVLFLWQSSYEVFYLTAAHGPQMVFFSVAHTWPGWLVQLLFASFFAYCALALFLLVVSVLGFFAPYRAHASFIKTTRLASLFVVPHLVAVITYDYWARPLFGS